MCDHSVCPATLTLVPRIFFDACDGLFTNYNWKEEQLERTQRLAGPRQNDVYVGVDVFARGDVIGGGFDTNKVGVTEMGTSLAQGSEVPLMALLGCAALGCEPGDELVGGEGSQSAGHA